MHDLCYWFENAQYLIVAYQERGQLDVESYSLTHHSLKKLSFSSQYTNSETIIVYTYFLPSPRLLTIPLKKKKKYWTT